MAEWTKAIAKERDELQSRFLVWVVGGALAACSVPGLMLVGLNPHGGHFLAKTWLVSLTFGLLVWAVRAATPAAAAFGALICVVTTAGTGRADRSVFLSGLAPLLALFLVTFAAGKIGRARKRKRAILADASERQEARRGRTAAQVLANLGAAGLVSVSALNHVPLGPVVLLAVLAEATADTVSSEIGSAFGGRPFLLTTLVRVEPGADGAVSLVGTLAGAAGAILVLLTGAWVMHLGPGPASVAMIGGLSGLLVDSLFGATLERRGYLGNDLVNFSSTVVAALVSAILSMFLAL